MTSPDHSPGHPPGHPPDATGSIEVEAPAEVVYSVVVDLDAMGKIAEETVAMRWTDGDDRAVPGAVFTGANRRGRRRWTTSCRVTDADPGRLFAFEVTTVASIPVARWAYAIEAIGEHRCRVTEATWDRRPGWFKRPAGWATGTPDRTRANAAHIAATLARLRARAEA